jgi:hypothetical protein
LFIQAPPSCFSSRPCTFIQGLTSQLPNHPFVSCNELQLLLYLPMLVHKRPMLLLFSNLWPYKSCPLRPCCFPFRPCSCILGLCCFPLPCSCILGCYFFLCNPLAA